jgi:hypothetical protein
LIKFNKIIKNKKKEIKMKKTMLMLLMFSALSNVSFAMEDGPEEIALNVQEDPVETFLRDHGDWEIYKNADAETKQAMYDSAQKILEEQNKNLEQANKNKDDNIVKVVLNSQDNWSEYQAENDPEIKSALYHSALTESAQQENILNRIKFNKTMANMIAKGIYVIENERSPFVSWAGNNDPLEKLLSKDEANRFRLKIHISATPGTAQKIAGIVLPYLMENQIPHKIIKNTDAFEKSFVSGVQQGKFITTYPQSNEEAVNLLQSLDEILYDSGIRSNDCIPPYEVNGEPVENVLSGEGHSGCVRWRTGLFFNGEGYFYDAEGNKIEDIKDDRKAPGKPSEMIARQILSEASEIFKLPKKPNNK